MSRGIWKETGEDDVVRCTECGTDIEEGCDHILLVADIAFGICEGGGAFDYWEGYRSQVQKVFAKCLKDKISPDWEHYEVKTVWDEMHNDIIDVPDEPRLPGEAFVDLMVEVLCSCGGTDIGPPVMSMSGRSQWAIRIMFASDPKAICEDAVKALDEWLVLKKPRPPRRRRRR